MMGTLNLRNFGVNKTNSMKPAGRQRHFGLKFRIPETPFVQYHCNQSSQILPVVRTAYSLITCM